MKTGIVLSDLHMYSRRSPAERYLDRITIAAARADVMVLNGDTFDFRWSTLPSIEATVDEAIAWLTDLTVNNPQCHFHFIQGNHDSYIPFLERLNALAAQTPNLTRHEFYLQIDRSLFLHGECANKKMTSDGVNTYRSLWHYDTKKSQYLGVLYALINKVGLGPLIHRAAFPRRLVVARVNHWLKHMCPETLASVDHVYFGHTHLPFSAHSHNGLTFHNTGSPVSGFQFNMLEFAIDEKETDQ